MSTRRLSMLPYAPSFNRSLRGFTLMEMLVIIAIIGVLAAIMLPKLQGSSYVASAKQVDEFFNASANNWRLANQTCGTSTDVAGSTLVASPSAANSLGLIINGSAYLNGAYQGCYNSSGVVPLIGKATGNPTDGFRVGGYLVSWSGGGGGIPITFSVTVPTDIAIILYRQYSSASGARNATSLPGGDATDQKFRFTNPSGGNTTVTYFVY